jgi:nucleotide-binding universal stress UspA family protein
MSNEDWSPSVLVAGVDGSEQSLHATRVATAIARRHGAKLFIVTVVRPPEGWWGIGGAPPTAQAMSHALSAAQRDVLDVAVDAVDLEGLEWETALEIGDPSTAVALFCEQKSADLLVIGRRGAGLIERVVIGSTADRLAHDAPCPVLIVP